MGLPKMGISILTQEWGQDTTTIGIGRCTNCQCSEPTTHATLLTQSTPARENFPRPKSGSWDLIPLSSCSRHGAFFLIAAALLAAVNCGPIQHVCCLSLNQRLKWSFLASLLELFGTVVQVR